MKQLIEPDLTVSGRIGYCQEYSRGIFHIPYKYPTAIAAYNAAQYKHTTPIPTDVAVFLWFSYREDGHVADNIPGRGIYSSPYSNDRTAKYQENTITHAVLPSVDELIRIYSYNKDDPAHPFPMKYLGWSEDNNGVRVAEGGDMQPLIDSSDEARKRALEFGIEIAGDDPFLLRAVKMTERDYYASLAPIVVNNMKAKDQKIAELQQLAQTGTDPKAAALVKAIKDIVNG